MMGEKANSAAGRYEGVRAVAMLVGAMSLAGSSVVVGKMLVASMPVFLTAFFSLLVAFLCMVPLTLGRWSEIRVLTAREWGYLFLQGLCGIVLFRVFTLYGLKSTGAVQAGIITGTTPAVLALLSLVILGERLSARSAAGVLLAMTGCIVINAFSWVEAGSEAGTDSLAGGLLVGAAVVSEALFTIFRKRVARTVSATVNTAVLIFCSLLLLAAPAAWQYAGMQAALPASALPAILYYGVFATVVAYLLWTSAVARVDGAIAGAATAAMPASSVLLAVLLLGERLHWHHLAGCLMIVAGIVVSSVQVQKVGGPRRHDR